MHKVLLWKVDPMVATCCIGFLQEYPHVHQSLLQLRASSAEIGWCLRLSLMWVSRNCMDSQRMLGSKLKPREPSILKVEACFLLMYEHVLTACRQLLLLYCLSIKSKMNCKNTCSLTYKIISKIKLDIQKAHRNKYLSTEYGYFLQLKRWYSKPDDSWI